MIVHLHDFGWHMDINLEYVCVHAGLRDKWYNRHGNSHTYIPFTLMHARKIFRLIKHMRNRKCYPIPNYMYLIIHKNMIIKGYGNNGRKHDGSIY